MSVYDPENQPVSSHPPSSETPTHALLPVTTVRFENLSPRQPKKKPGSLLPAILVCMLVVGIESAGYLLNGQNGSGVVPAQTEAWNGVAIVQ